MTFGFPAQKKLAIPVPYNNPNLALLECLYALIHLERTKDQHVRERNFLGLLCKEGFMNILSAIDLSLPARR